jgi:WD40 repeat protein
MDFHPRLPWMALATFDGTIALADCPSMEVVHQAQPFRHPIVDLGFHPRGEVLAGACLSDGVGLWRVAEDGCPAESPFLNPGFLKDGSERVWAVAFSHDQQLLAAGCESGAIILYDTTTWQRIATLPTGRPRLRYLRFSPDDSRLYASSYTGEGCLIELLEVSRSLEQLGVGWQQRPSLNDR